ncbi:MAG: hypothetical protein CUN53_05575 [Phototrophicales bacterium]|nr:MAG: hypothetical protein CUN53_05575 [Phototrophicales bacterium]
MLENPLIILAVCGLGIVCVGLIVIGLIGLRLGGGVLDFFSIFSNASMVEDDERVQVSRRPNLRNIANANDFDSAVAKNVIRQDQNIPSLRDSRPSSARLDAARRSTLNPDQRRKQNDDYSEDEIFGGILDEDGDGSVDNDRL